VLSTSARVEEEFYKAVKASAEANHRTVSEELIWRTRHSFEWEKAFGDARKVLADAAVTARGVVDHAIEQAAPKQGWTLIHGLAGTYLFKPGVPAVLLEVPNPEVKALITDTVREVIAQTKKKEQSSS
jgi:hypothetical protein